MQTTIPVRVSKRKAREQRLWEFQCLIDFANLGDTPDDWAMFCKNWPEPFPASITERIYMNAEVWWELTNLPDTRPDNYREILRRCRADPDGVKDWANFARECRRQLRPLRPYLLYYRNLLRAVWRREDPGGGCLKELLGFDAVGIPFHEKGEKVKEDRELYIWPIEEPESTTIGPLTWKARETETSIGLPTGTPVVDGNTGTIGWDFDCPFQRAVYDLMQERWRAMVCPQCEKYFVADKTAQRYCSPECYLIRKGCKALDYYNRKGRYARQKAKALRAKLQRSKS